MWSGQPPPAAADAGDAGSARAWTDAAALLVTAVWTALGVLLWAMFPMTGTVLLPLCCVAPLAWYFGVRGHLPWYPLSLVTKAFIVVAVYLLINASWSLSMATATSTVIFAFLMVGALHAVLNTLPDLDEPPLRAMALGTLAGLGAAAALLCLEVYSDQSLRRFLISLIPALQPGPQHMERAGGQMMRLASYLPNASISVLAVMFWPAALLWSRLGLPRAPRWGLVVAAGVAGATVAGSEHATSQVALTGACLAFGLFRLRPKLAMPAVAAGWVAASLLVVPVAWLLYSVEAHRAPWLPESARHRIVIWHYTSQLIPKAPFLGAGIGTARAINEAERADAETRLVPGTKFYLSTSLHSHNAYLQVWYEAGAVGAFMMLALGLIILRALTRFATDVQPYLVATFAACALLAASAYSIWAPWFMACMAMAAVFAGLGAALPPPPALRRLPDR